MIRAVVVAGLLVAAASAANAQFPRRVRPSPEPSTWGSFSVGLTQPFQIVDGATQSTWSFGTAQPQYRASLEKTVQPQTTIGVAATMATVPLTYTDNAGLSQCSAGCDADASVKQVFALLHYGSGTGFHQLIDLELGATLFSNFKERLNGAQIGPPKTVSDFSFGIGYGFGFGLSPSTDLQVGENLASVVHKKTGLPASQSNISRIFATRIGLKMGL